MNEIEEKVNTFLEDADKKLSELGIGCKPIIYFPNRDKVPFLSRIVWKFIIKKQGGILDTNFFPQKK